MSKNRKTLFLIFLSLILVCAFVLTAMLLIYILQNSENILNPKPTETEVPDNTETPDENEDDPIVIDTNKDIDPYFVTINEDKTISIFDSEGIDLVIEIEDKDWTDIRFSPDNSYISVLGINEGVENIYLYEIDEREGSWVTNFSENNDGFGIGSYTWVNSKDIFYIAGENNNSWLHKYNVDTKQERLKVAVVDGEIVNYFNSPTQDILVQFNDGLKVVDLEGFEKPESDFDFESAFIDSVNINYLIQEQNEFGDKSFSIYDGNELIESSLTDFNFACSVGEADYIGYRFHGLLADLRYLEYNFYDNEIGLIYSEDKETIQDINFDSILCTESEIFVSENDLVGNNEVEKWYRISDEVKTELEFLQDKLEVNVIN